MELLAEAGTRWCPGPSACSVGQSVRAKIRTESQDDVMGDDMQAVIGHRPTTLMAVSFHQKSSKASGNAGYSPAPMTAYEYTMLDDFRLKRRYGQP